MSVILEAIKAGLAEGLTADTIIAEIADQGLDNPGLMIETLTLEIIKLLDCGKV